MNRRTRSGLCRDQVSDSALGPYGSCVAMPVEIRTKRLRLRLLGQGDLDVVHRLFSSAGHTIGDGPVADPASTREWLERRQRRHQEHGLAWFGVWERGGTFLGTCGVFRGRCGEEPEIGYEIDTLWRRRRYAIEAVRAVTEAAHKAGHTRVWATIRPGNIGSVRTMQAVGYDFVRSEPDDKGALDYYVSEFAVLDKNVPSVD